MTTTAITIVSFVAAAAAAVWPYLPTPSKPTGLAANDRAGWVNRLFELAAQADESGEAQVAGAARALIAALVAQQPSTRRGA